MEEQGRQCHVEDQSDGRPAEDTPGEVIVDADRRAEGERGERATSGENVENERRKCGRYGELPAETTIIGHQQSTECIQRHDSEDDENAETKSADDVTLDARSIDDREQREDTVDVQEPCGDLQCLRLHSIEPFAQVDTHRRQVWQK